MLRLLPMLLLAACAMTSRAQSLPERAWSYEDLDYVLERYITDDGRADYDGLAADRAALDRFVAALAERSPDSHPALFATEADRLAYWMNAYNALMLRRVVEAWPVESVRNIRTLYGVFWMELHPLGGTRWTLRGLENKIIRARFAEPRIHFAINCASVGCPALPRRAWRGDTLDADLDRAARVFIADPRHVSIDRAGGVIRLSSIFKWFTEDFTTWLRKRNLPDSNGIVDYVWRYLPPDRPPDPAALTVEWIPYDWSINSVNEPE